MFKHAIVNGFAHALIEIRQDLIADEAVRRPGRSGWRRSLTRSTAVPIYMRSSNSARAPGRYDGGPGGR